MQIKTVNSIEMNSLRWLKSCRSVVRVDLTVVVLAHEAQEVQKVVEDLKVLDDLKVGDLRADALKVDGPKKAKGQIVLDAPSRERWNNLTAPRQWIQEPEA
jgi:hypothetical protein